MSPESSTDTVGVPATASVSARELPKQQRSRETVETILNAAAQLLVEDGYDKASTNRVAQEARVNIGTLYRYFPNKEMLFATLFERHVEQVAAAVNAKSRDLTDKSLPAAVRGLIEGMLEGVMVEPELHQALIEQVPPDARPEQGRVLEERIQQIVRDYIESHKAEMRPKDSDLAAFVVVHTVRALTHAATLEHPEYLQDGLLIDEIVDLVVGYLAPIPEIRR